MVDEEIALRIGGLTDEQRGELHRICATRKDQPGASTAVYVKVSSDTGEALHHHDLVWMLGSTQAAARHDVYAYWEKYIA
jgi:hypothetical protein